MKHRSVWVWIHILTIATLGCRHDARSGLSGSGGVKPEGDENFLAIPIIKYQTDFHGKVCPEGQAFFSFCGLNRINETYAVTSRHCVIRENLATGKLEPSDVLWFPDHQAMHDVLHDRAECLDIDSTLDRLLKEANGQVVPKEAILSPQKDDAFVEFPDIAFIRDPRFVNTKFKILPILDPDTLSAGTQVTKIGFGTTDCSKELTPELKETYPGYTHQYDRHKVSQYGVSKTYAELLDRASMAKYSPKNAKKRDFEQYIYYLAGKDGMYGCLSDSSATLVKQDDGYKIIGAHRGGIPIYDESEGAESKTPTPYKLELAVKISAPEVCQFVKTIPEVNPAFVGVCKP